MTNLLRRPLVFGLSFVLMAALGCGGSVGGPNSTDPSVGVRLIVQRSLPTNGQEVLSTLADAGEEQDAGKVTLTFSERVDPVTILDANNAFNGLTSDVNILNSAFQRVPGTPSITGARGNILEFVPAGGVLPNGQYTVTVSRDVKSFDGSQLNQGIRDYHSAFTVGSDTYNPVIRNTFPAPNQKDVSKTSPVIVTFNESLNGATVNSGTFTVVDGGTNPPTPIAGVVSLSQDGFDIVFTPDPANPMPPSATIVVTISAGLAGVTDAIGNPFDGDLTPPAGTYENYVFQFETVKEPPLPNAPVTFNANTGDAAVYYGTDAGIIGVLNEGPFTQGGSVDLSLWGNGNPIQYGESFIMLNNHVGRPGEIVVDRRFNPTTGHSWFYVIDEENRAVHIMASQTCRLVHSWADLPDPAGLAITGRTLYVTNYANDSITALDIGQISPVGTLGASDLLKGLSAFDKRNDLTIGRGPRGVAHSLATSLLFTANQLENSCTVVDTANFKVTTSFPVGTNPQDVATTPNYPGIGYFAFISCLGGGGDENGSVALYWNVPNGLQANITGFKNPKGLAFDNGVSVWVANSGSDTVSRLTLSVAGGGFAATILPIIDATVTTGRNPVDVTVEPYWPMRNAQAQCVISADRGDSQLTFLDPNQPSRPVFRIPIAGIRTVAGLYDQ
jgi:YVTN family beta-propeller protein